VTLCKISIFNGLCFSKDSLVNFVTLWVWVQPPLTCVRKIAKSNHYLRHICLSVCPSARNNSAPTGRIFVEFIMGAIYGKSVEEMQILLRYDRKGVGLHEYHPTLFIISRSALRYACFVLFCMDAVTSNVELEASGSSEQTDKFKRCQKTTRLYFIFVALSSPSHLG
jgi:hypothetical protein